MNEKRLTRVEEGRMLAGVCTGLGRYLKSDWSFRRVSGQLCPLVARHYAYMDRQSSGPQSYIIVLQLLLLGTGLGFFSARSILQ